MSAFDPIVMPIHDADRAAWEAICAWPERAGLDPVRDGLDYGELTRWFLWDKVGRAVRRARDPQGFAFEQGWLDEQSKERPAPVRPGVLDRARAAYGSVLDLARDAKDALRLRRARITTRRPVIYVPQALWHVEAAAAALIASEQFIVVADGSLPGYRGAYRFRCMTPASPPDGALASELHGGIVRGLKRGGVTLLTQDAHLVREQIARLVRDVQRAEAEMRALRPDGILVLGDNHPPYQVYVLVGRRDGIPTAMLQHGLDCERLYLDEAYADAIAVWGEARRARYVRDSQRRPRLIEVTGNPAHDARRLPERMDTRGDDWLWLARPHNPEKCYAPSRSPHEGLDILDALATALERTPGARLVVKPHPSEGGAVLARHAAQRALADRVEIVCDRDRSVADLLPRARVVISEDSTAGMDAMFAGKPLVLAHFAASEPATPFVEYGAALAARSPGMLSHALRQAADLDGDTRARMLDGQRAFLRDHAGPCDGRAGERFVRFMSRVLARTFSS